MDQCRILTFPKITDPRGSLSFIEEERHLPFTIRRVYYVYDVPGGESRGAHAHKALHQVIIAVGGSFTVTVDDGRERKAFLLNRPFQGLYIPPMVWRDCTDFSSGAVCLVLVSEAFDPADYIRDYDEFRKAAGR